jgi:uncharacterized spore protein YtfJ
MDTQPIQPNATELTAIMHDLTTILQQEGNVRAVFGTPVKLDNHVVIPVATIKLGGGGGGAIRKLGPAADVVRRLLGKDGETALETKIGGGGGWTIDVRPVGFLSEQAGRVVFTKIDEGGAPPVIMRVPGIAPGIAE